MISHSYDEMTGIGQFNSQEFWLAKTAGILATRKLIKLRICVVEADEQKIPFLVFDREGEDWLWLSDTSFHGLLDGTRFSGEGSLISSDTKVLGNMVVCMETVTVELDIDLLAAFAGFETFKIRIGSLDFELGPDFREAASDMLSAISH